MSGMTGAILRKTFLGPNFAHFQVIVVGLIHILGADRYGLGQRGDIF